MTLTIDDLDLERHDRCQYDYVAVNFHSVCAFSLLMTTYFCFLSCQVFDGLREDSPSIGERLCGQLGETVIESTGTEMMVQFRTDGSVSQGGFRATVRSQQEAGKGVYVYTKKFVLESCSVQ